MTIPRSRIEAGLLAVSEAELRRQRDERFLGITTRLPRPEIPDFDLVQSVFPYDLLQLWTGEPFKVCWRTMERAGRRRLVDFGVSLRSGWLTDKGETLFREHLAGSGIEVGTQGRLSLARRAA